MPVVGDWKKASTTAGIAPRKAPRYGMIAVSATLQSLGDEEVARHVGHRGQHARVRDAVVVAQALDHALARDAEARGLRGRPV